MRKLIVNGDDFGFNREITDGILKCHKNGCVTSTTLMPNMPAAEYAVEQGKKFPNLSIGVHLNITIGRPISNPQKIPTLVNPDGTFRGISEIGPLAKHCRLSVEQLEREFSAQVEKILSLGIAPTHCDSHHTIMVNPQPCIAMIRVIKKYNIKRLRTYRGLYRLDKTGSWGLRNLLEMLRVNTIRGPKIFYYNLLHRYLRLKGYRLPDIKCGFHKIISSSPLNFDITGWEKLIHNIPPGVVEIATHPGLSSDDPLDEPIFRKQRVVEYNLLVNPECKNICEKYGVKLISFNEL